MRRILFACLCSILLHGCSRGTPPKTAAEQFIENPDKKALVLGSFRANKPLGLFTTPYSVQFIGEVKEIDYTDAQRRALGHKNDHSKMIAFDSTFISGDKKIHLFKPGKYVLAAFGDRLQPKSALRIYLTKGWSETDEQSRYVLNVNAGDIIYVGDMVIDLVAFSLNYNIDVKDNLEDYKNKLPADVYNGVEKRLFHNNENMLRRYVLLKDAKSGLIPVSKVNSLYNSNKEKDAP